LIISDAQDTPERGHPATPASSTPPKPASSTSPTTRRAPAGGRARWLIAAVVVVAAALIVWRACFAGPRVPPNLVVVSGRIDGDDSAVAAKAAGRILEVRVREGDSVAAGGVLAILDDEQVRAREDQAGAAVAAAEAKSRSANDQIAVLEEQLAQNQLQTAQSQVDAAGRVRQAEADLGAAEADLAQQQAAYQLAAFDKEAYAKLAKTGAVSERQGLSAAATAGQQAAAVAAARRRVEAARGALTTARANLDNPGIRAAQVALVHRQIAEQQAEAAGAAAQAQQARAQLVEAQANRRDLVVRAPFAGTVVTRAAEPGEVVTAGTTVVTMLDLAKVYLRGFVPEGEIGKVRVQQPARVYIDSDPRRPIAAYVSRIDPQASFTPENTYFRDDRVKQVVGVKLQLRGAVGYAKPGMPADGEILAGGGGWPDKRVAP
jgi:HlyD family secretion protein